MTRSQAKHLDRSAFTLLELLIAMAIVVMISVVIYASLNIAMKSRQSSEAMLVPTRQAAVALDLLTHDLENALPPSQSATATINGHSTNNQQILAAFAGNTGNGNGGFRADDLQFATAVDGPHHADGDADVRLVELTVKAPDDSRLGSDPCLVRRVVSPVLSTSDPKPVDEEVLCRHVLGFQLRYWDGNQWQDTWDSTQQTNNASPLAVEITLDLQPPQDRPQMQVHYRRVVALATSNLNTSNGGL